MFHDGDVEMGGSTPEQVMDIKRQADGESVFCCVFHQRNGH